MSHDPSDCDGGPYPLGRFPSLRRRLLVRLNSPDGKTSQAKFD